MWDKLHQVWVYALLAFLAGCALPKKSGAEDIIETVGKAGCHIASLEFDEKGQIEQITCHDTVRYSR